MVFISNLMIKEQNFYNLSTFGLNEARLVISYKNPLVNDFLFYT